MVKINYIKDFYLFMTFPFLGFLGGWKLDRLEDERLSRYRDKSKLYGREVPPSEPSW